MVNIYPLFTVRANIRYKFISKLIKIITPNLYKKLDILDLLNKKVMKLPRQSTLILKQYYSNKKIIGVEIGVNLGLNASSLLKELNIEKLYLIDFWKDSIKYPKYSIVLDLFKDNKKVIIIKDYSYLAVRNFKDNSLDFIYIDASHKYLDVFQDICLWSKKVKLDGIISGHDIFNEIDVYKAILEYCTEYNYDLEIKPPDWYFIKTHL